MTIKEQIGVEIPEILLPVGGIDLAKWAVIACDQFTSQPEYWQQVADLVGESPSTLHMILPEVWLEDEGLDKRIQHTQDAMRAYLAEGVFKAFKGLVLVERTIGNRTRQGLMIALDLEAYDYNKGSQTLIRATEGTILERIPPRIRIRKDAPLELPHILVLYDDPQYTVMSNLLAQKENLPICYDFELMMGSGHLIGRLVEDPAMIEQVLSALAGLADPQAFEDKYHLPANQRPLLFAMGDGNHSLATAKAIWEEIKPQVGMQHPARYALVEIENLHDPALEFEPIHRLLFNLPGNIKEALQAWFGKRIIFNKIDDLDELLHEIDSMASLHHHFALITTDGFEHIEIKQPDCNLPVGSLQAFLDAYLKENRQVKIDYVHGSDVLKRLGTQPGNAGFYLPAMDKKELFKTVILDGALPRKTFSMGEAHEKRFYMECRKIR